MNKDAFGAIVLIAIVISVIFVIGRTMVRSGLDAASGKVQRQMEESLAARKDFAPSYKSYSTTASELVAIDETIGKFTLYFVSGSKIMIRTGDASLVLGVEVLIDEVTSVSSLGSAVGVGQGFIGAGKSFTNSYVRSIRARVLLNDTSTPSLVINFLDSKGYGKFASDSAYVRDAYAEATRFKQLMDIVTLRARVVETQPMISAERKCPYCAELIKAEAIICRFCQREMHAPAIYQAEAETDSSEEACLAQLALNRCIVTRTHNGGWEVTGPSGVSVVASSPEELFGLTSRREFGAINGAA